jgi:WD40 repeat protein
VWDSGYEESQLKWGPIERADAVLEGHSGAVKSCAYSPDSSRIVSGSRYEESQLKWGPIERADAVLEGHSGAVKSCAYSPDGSRIVSGSDDKTVRLWDVGSGELRGLLCAGAKVKCCAFDPVGPRLCTGDDSGSLMILELRGEASARPQPMIRALDATGAGRQAAGGDKKKRRWWWRR